MTRVKRPLDDVSPWPPVSRCPAVSRLAPPPPPPPPPPPKLLKIRVKSRLLPPRPEQLADTPPPGQGWSRPIDQNASRPMPFELAQLTMSRALSWVTTSPALSLLPIIGVRPMLPNPVVNP